MQGYYCADESAHVYMFHADALTLLRGVPENWTHAIITDPPYGLSHLGPSEITQALKTWFDGDREKVPVGKGFMGRDWDSFVPPPALWDECYRVLKPGGYMAVFAGSRTFDMMALSIRLAGFEIRDTVEWIYGSGFPKSQNISKMMDKQAGAEREIVAIGSDGAIRKPRAMAPGGAEREAVQTVSESVTDDAKEWEGWGTALKPAHEPIIIARKPLSEKTVAKNVLEHRTGGINVDATRVGAEVRMNPSAGNKPGGAALHMSEYGMPDGVPPTEAKGRWPANVVLSHFPDCKPDCSDDCAVSEMDDQSGKVGAAAPVTGFEQSHTGENGIYGTWGRVASLNHTDEGGASRFFNDVGCVEDCGVAEIDRQTGHLHSAGPAQPGGDERNGDSSMFGIGNATSSEVRHGDTGSASRFFNGFKYQAKAASAERPRLDGQAHPTVKPLGLLQWLVRLLVPDQGCVLDPFAGTGTTLEAARNENKRAVGIDSDEFSCKLTAKRLGVSDESVDT